MLFTTTQVHVHTHTNTQRGETQLGDSTNVYKQEENKRTRQLSPKRDFDKISNCACQTYQEVRIRSIFLITMSQSTDSHETSEV